MTEPSTRMEHFFLDEKQVIFRIPPEGFLQQDEEHEIIVQEEQNAVIITASGISSVSGPGRYLLPCDKDVSSPVPDDPNLPALTEPFAVLFVRMGTFTDGRWGTPHPLTPFDTGEENQSLRCYGSYSFTVRDASALITKCGIDFSTLKLSDIDNLIRTSILKSLNEACHDKIRNLSSFEEMKEEIQLNTRARLYGELERMGLEIIEFRILGTNLPANIGDKQIADLEQPSPSITQPTEPRKKNHELIEDIPSLPPELIPAPGIEESAILSSRSKMDRCSDCGQSIPDRAEFCPGCGTAVTVKKESCRECKKPLPEGARFCPGCGTPRQLLCPGCGETPPVKANFCPACGMKLP